MEGFVGKTGAKVHVLRLDPGDLLLESIQEYIAKEKIKDGVVVSGIGTLSDCVMHMVMTTAFSPYVEHVERWVDTPLEVSALSGMIANGVEHLHMVVSDHKVAFSGHVEPGCRILYVGEVVIQEFEDMGIGRKVNEHGYTMLRKLETNE